MASEESYPLSSTTSFDEQRWLTYIRDSLDKDQEEDLKIPVSVFTVPKPLLAIKPEAFAPQLLALGPYHHWRPQLCDMERYKLAAAKSTQKKLHGIKLDQLVEKFREYEFNIRAHYHRYLELTGETLAWMMVIDASFLLEFLHTYSDSEGKVFKKSQSMSHMVDSERMKLAYNLILRDAVMLENQIPLFIVSIILHHQYSSPEAADYELAKMLMGFLKEVSPFKFVTDNFSPNNLNEQAHLLQFLYSRIVSKAKEKCKTTENDHVHIEIEQGHSEIEQAHIGEPEPKDEFIGDSSHVRQLCDCVWTYAKGLNLSPVSFVTKLLSSKPFTFVMNVPWKLITSLPLISALKGPIESFFAMKGDEKSNDEDSTKNKPPLVEEIMIPSVSELIQAGVRFARTNGDLTTIKFDTKTVTFYLPTVMLDVNTEVVLRNLVAYETSVESGPMVFTRYTELINGIIDTEEDVKLLRRSGIIMNHMKSDGEVANLWNGMSRSVRLTKVGFIDKVLVDVNKYYNSRWSVKSRRMMKTYVLGSWQLLAFLAAILMLVMTCIQAFCSVYRCSAHLSSLTQGT